MTFPRFRIVDLLLLVAGIALGIALSIECQSSFAFRTDLIFATHLGLLTTALVVLWGDRLSSRPFFAGFAAFAVVYLVFGLRLGSSDDLINRSGIGMGVAFMAGVAAC